MARTRPTYLAHVVAGLEPVARAELQADLPGLEIVRTVERFDERTGLIIFHADASPSALLALRTVEDVFVQAAESGHIPGDRSGPAAVRRLLNTAETVEPAASLALRARPGRGRVTFRVIARAAGSHAFRRIDLQRAAEAAIKARFPAWRLVEDDARLEFWVQLVGSWFVAGFRLSDNALRQRAYRRVNLPAALKPTIAAAMVRLTRPEDEDVFLDPMCGSGTILIERALAGRYRLLLGGDADNDAVAATRANVGPRYQPIEIRRWDAAKLPLGDASVTALACNLPFGRQIGTPAGNRALYPAFLREWMRVLQPGGRMVLLSSEHDLLRRTLDAHPALHSEQRLRVLVRGVRATLIALRREEA